MGDKVKNDRAPKHEHKATDAEPTLVGTAKGTVKVVKCKCGKVQILGRSAWLANTEEAKRSFVGGQKKKAKEAASAAPMAQRQRRPY